MYEKTEILSSLFAEKPFSMIRPKIVSSNDDGKIGLDFREIKAFSFPENIQVFRLVISRVRFSRICTFTSLIYL